MHMPTTSLKPVRSYLDPGIYNRMEESRAGLRKVSRSRFIEDAILEKLERMEQRPIHERRRRSSSTN
jgi:hypothetical protein